MTREFIRDILVELGMDPSLQGFWMIVDAEIHLFENPDSIHAITKELYPHIAQKYGGTASRVERNIRNAKERALQEDVDYHLAKELHVENCLHNSETVNNRRFLGALMLYLQKREEMGTE